MIISLNYKYDYLLPVRKAGSLCRTSTFAAKQMISEVKLRLYGVTKVFQGGNVYKSDRRTT